MLIYIIVLTIAIQYYIIYMVAHELGHYFTNKRLGLKSKPIFFPIPHNVIDKEAWERLSVDEKIRSYAAGYKANHLISVIMLILTLVLLLAPKTDITICLSVYSFAYVIFSAIVYVLACLINFPSNDLTRIHKLQN